MRSTAAAIALCVAAAVAGFGSSDANRADAAVPAGGDAADGRLAYVGRVADGDLDSRGEPVAVRGSADLAMGDGGRALYLATELGLEVFARDAETGRLDRVQSAAQGVDLSRAALAWDAARGRVLADDCGAWRAFPLLRDDAGASGRLAAGVELAAEDDPYTCGDALLLQADGAFAYRAGAGRVDVFELAAGPAGAPRFAQTLEAPGLSGAALDGDRLYALADDGLLAYQRDAVTGLLAMTGDPIPLDAPATALAVADARAYVVEARGVGMFDLSDPLNPPRRAAAPFPDAPDGGGCRFAAAVRGADAVDVFCRHAAFGARWPRDASDGATWTADVAAELPTFGPLVAVAASPDGRHVYVATPASGLLVFARRGASQAAAPAIEQRRHAGPEAQRPAAAYLPGPVPGVPRRRGYRPLDETGPDLRVADPTVVRTSFAGRQFRIRVRVRNVADPVGEEPTLSFHRSEDDHQISTSDPVVATTVVDDVDFDGVWYRSDVQNPDSGAYYGACVAAVAGELDTTNNCSVGVFVAMGVPDLAVTVAASEAQPGEPFELTATVRNDGADRSPNADLLFFSSPDDVIGLFDTRLESLVLGPLDSGASVEEVIQVTAPSSTDTRYYGACAKVQEGRDADHTNNCSPGVTASTADPTDPTDPTDPSEPTATAETIDLGGIGDAYGIAHHDGRLYVVDNDADQVHAYDRSGTRNAAQGFALQGGNANSNGMAYADGGFLLLDSADDKVYAYSADGTRNPARDFDLAKGGSTDSDSNLDASGIAHADGRLHVVDYADRKVYAYGTDGARDAAADFALAAGAPTEPTGIARAGGLFFVLGDGSAFAYRPDGQRVPGWDLALHPDNEDASGIVYADGFFVLDRADRKVYVYRERARSAYDAQGFHLDAGGFVGMAHAADTLYTIRSTQLGSGVYAFGTDGTRRPAQDFDLDEGNGFPAGIAHASGTLYVADFADKKVYAYGTDGARRSSDDFDLHMESGFPLGMAHADGTLYVVEYRLWALGYSVYAYGTDGARRPEKDFDLDVSFISVPAGVAYADGTLYVAQEPLLGYRAWVDAYGTDGARRPEEDFDLDDNHHPSGMAHADGTLHVMGRRGKVHAYGTDGTRRPAEDFDIRRFNDSPTGIAHADGTLYVADDYAQKVYAYGTDGARRPEKDFDLDDDNHSPWGMARADGTLYLADDYTQKVYAYGTDGARRPEKDFDLEPASGGPRGIAHADGTLYVVRFLNVHAYGTDGARRPEKDFGLDEHISPSGIIHVHGTLYVVDQVDEKVYAYGTDGARRFSEDFYLYRMHESPTGVAHADGTLYVAAPGLVYDADGRSPRRMMYTYGPDDRARRSGASFDLDDDNRRPSGMAHADGTLYVVDDEKVFAYGTDGTRRSTEDFDLDDDHIPSGLAHADGTLYVPDWNGRVYAYGTDGARRPAEDFVLDPDNGHPGGIAHADGTLYVVDWDDQMVYAYGTDGARRSAEDFDLDEINKLPWDVSMGIAHADGTLYLVDSDETVYAYGTDGVRRSADDFHVYLANGSPRDIAYAEGRFYVADQNDNKVYVYHPPPDG